MKNWEKDQTTIYVCPNCKFNIAMQISLNGFYCEACKFLLDKSDLIPQTVTVKEAEIRHYYSCFITRMNHPTLDDWLEAIKSLRNG